MSEYQRLPDSKRNELIAEFNEGKINPDFEVIPSKTQKGKYTVRRRKVPLPSNENVQNTPPVPEPVEEQHEEKISPESFQDDASYFPSYKMKKNAMFRELQMEMNKMFIEQMKMMRQQIKHENRKRQKLKDKSQMVYDLLAEIAKEPAPQPQPQEPIPEPEPEPEPEKQPVEEYHSPDYFNNTYKSEVPPKKVQFEQPPPEPEPKQYAQPYEQDLDHIDGTIYKPYSRRDRLNFKNFNI